MIRPFIAIRDDRETESIYVVRANTTAEALGLALERHQKSNRHEWAVYDIDADLDGQFDVIGHFVSRSWR